jgi:uncharacterized protein (TIGR00661 family)
MARIFYGMSGDGRGHATRVQTVVGMLRDRHEVVVHAPLDAYDLLAPAYRDTAVEVREIPGVRSRYDDAGNLHYLKTVLHGVPRLVELNEVVDELADRMAREAPELVITDFDGLLPRAARRAGVPHLSIDHQHLLVHGDFSGLPVPLRAFAAAAGVYIRTVSRSPVATIVSSFQHLPLASDREDVHAVGALLREEIRDAEPWPGGHLLAYFRRDAPPSVLEALAAAGGEVRIYGLGDRGRRGSLRFRPVDNAAFVEDLAGCRAVVSTAGNQLVGEALYLDKPVLAIPEPGNREQEINAHLLERNGGGTVMTSDEMTPGALRAFLDRLEVYRSRIDPGAVSGNDEVEALLRRYLPAGSPARDATAA